MVSRLLIALMICGLVGGMLFFTGCRRDGGHHPDPQKIVAKLSDKLDLDESQRDRLTEMVTDLEAEIVALHEDEGDSRQAAIEMIRSEAVNATDLQALYGSKREMVDLMAEKVIPYLVEFHALLTPEQRETLAAKIEDHQAHRRCRFFKQ